MLNVENKVIAITGASSGIGEATAKLLAENGAKVILGARRTEKLAKIVEAICSQGGIAEFKAVDVTNREHVKAFVHFAKDKFGRVDVIFNNAGVMPLSPMNALKVEEMGQYNKCEYQRCTERDCSRLANYGSPRWWTLYQYCFYWRTYGITYCCGLLRNQICCLGDI